MKKTISVRQLIMWNEEIGQMAKDRHGMTSILFEVNAQKFDQFYNLNKPHIERAYKDLMEIGKKYYQFTLNEGGNVVWTPNPESKTGEALLKEGMNEANLEAERKVILDTLVVCQLW